MLETMMRFAAALCVRLSTCAWLGRKRVLAYAGVLLAMELVTFLFLVAGTHGWIVPLGQPTTTDFASFYAAGSLVDAGQPASVYDQVAHRAAEEQATAPGIGYQFFYYPPVYLILCAALAHLPYLVAFVAFEAATLVLYLLVARRTLGESGWAAILPILAFPSVFWTFGLGQNAFLTAALFGSALLLVDRRPLGSGALFGLLCYKPHLGWLIPVALLAGGRWRAFLAATATVALLVATSVLLFGSATWHDFVALASGSTATYESGRIDFAGFVNLFGGVRLLGGSLYLAYAAQAAIMIVSAGLVIFVWRRNLSLPIRAAALAAAAVAAAPVALLYDLMLAAIAGGWLIRAARRSGFLAWEKITLVTLFVVPLFMRNVGTAWHVPLGPLVPLALLALVYARARAEIAAPVADAAPDDAAIRDLGRKLAPYLGGA